MGFAKGLMYTYYESKENGVEELIVFGLKKAAIFLEKSHGKKLDSKKVFNERLCHQIRLFWKEPDFWRLHSMLVLQLKPAAKFRKEFMDFIEQYLAAYMAYFKKKKSKNTVTEAMLFGSVPGGLMVDLITATDEYPLEVGDKHDH